MTETRQAMIDSLQRQLDRTPGCSMSMWVMVPVCSVLFLFGAVGSAVLVAGSSVICAVKLLLSILAVPFIAVRSWVDACLIIKWFLKDLARRMNDARTG